MKAFAAPKKNMEVKQVRRAGARGEGTRCGDSAEPSGRERRGSAESSSGVCETVRGAFQWSRGSDSLAHGLLSLETSHDFKAF